MVVKCVCGHSEIVPLVAAAVLLVQRGQGQFAVIDVFIAVPRGRGAHFEQNLLQLDIDPAGGIDVGGELHGSWRRASGKKEINHGAQGVDVAALRGVFTVERYLRRGIILGGKLIGGPGLEHPTNLCDAKVDQLKLKIFGDQNIRGGDIPVYDRVLMGVPDGIGQLLHQMIPGGVVGDDIQHLG